MKAGLSCWNQRIAPVLDVARELLVVEIEAGRIITYTREELPQESGWHKAKRLHELGIDILICGAISKSMQNFVEGQGINIHPFIAGNLEEIIDAWICGKLSEQRFNMPGCGRRRRRRHCGRLDQGFNQS